MTPESRERRLAPSGGSYLSRLAILLVVVGSLGALPTAAPASNHPLLEKMGLDAADLPQELYLVRSPGPPSSEPGILLHGRLGDTYLVSGERELVEGLKRRGCFVLELPAAAARTEPARVPISVAEKAADPAVQALVDQLTWESLGGKIQWLVDFGTRYSFDPMCAVAAESLQVFFSDLGLAVDTHSFLYQDTLMHNVTATQVGSTYPDQFYVICGHYDSISQSITVDAPGADDNGSGTAAVMSAAEILSPHSFEYSIKYVCFAGEEQGLVGSYYYVRDMIVAAGVDVRGALNFDMLGYWEEGLEDELEIETNAASVDLAAVVVAAAQTYTGAVFELHQYDDAWWGDHYRFWQNGIPAVNHEESWDWGDPDFNPEYHTNKDLPDLIDPDFCLRNAKVGLASLAVLAQLDTPSDVPLSPGSGVALRLSARPNPFNGRVRLLVETDAGLTEIDLEIFDLRGRMVTRIPVDLVEGRGEVSWLGRDAGGRPVESGVYLCRSPQGMSGSALRISYVK